jgi:hypothetical protein
MHFSFILLRIKSLYMFRALLAHPQEMLHKPHLVYCVRIMSFGYSTIAVKLHSQLTHARSIPSAVCESPPENEQVMFETCRGSLFSINLMKSASRWFHYTDILWCAVGKTLMELLVPRCLDRNPNIYYTSRICYKFIINTVLDKFLNVPLEHQTPPFLPEFPWSYSDSLPV